MTTTLPALDSTTHVASVTYACTFSKTVINGGAVVFMVPQPVQFLFTFETGRTQPTPGADLWDVTVDSSWFDQETEETNIAAALDSICTTIASLIGATQAQIQQTVTVQRTWRINPNQVGSLAPVQMPSAPIIYAETMTYPLAVIAGAAGLGGGGSASGSGNAA